MSIINDALKKAGATKEGLDWQKGAQPSAAPLFEMHRKKEGLNWGPVFIILVLVLITAPILAPRFSTPVRKDALPVAPAPIIYSESDMAALPVSEEPSRNAQFGIEEIPLMPSKPNFLLSGIVYSPESAYCLINNKVLRVGESVSGATVLDVSPNSVTLEYNGEKMIFPLSD